MDGKYIVKACELTTPDRQHNYCWREFHGRSQRLQRLGTLLVEIPQGTGDWRLGEQRAVGAAHAGLLHPEGDVGC
jgi:hypothetical protein